MILQSNIEARTPFLLLIVLICYGCSNDELEVMSRFACEDSGKFDCDVDAVLAPWVNSFYAEAEVRGIELQRNNLVVLFQDEVNVNNEVFVAYGWSDYNGTGQRRVEITRSAWNGFKELEKEVLMFHELGHAILSRPHRNSRLPNCERASIMCGGICPEFYLHYEDGHDPRRLYYMDELFEPCIQGPDWALTDSPDILDVFLKDTIGLENENWKAFERESTQVGISDSIAYSGKYSLVITSNKSLEDGPSAVWQYTTTKFPHLESGTTARINVKVKTVDMKGDWGMAFQARNASNELIFFESTSVCVNAAQGTTDFEILELYHTASSRIFEK